MSWCATSPGWTRRCWRASSSTIAVAWTFCPRPMFSTTRPMFLSTTFSAPSAFWGELRVSHHRLPARHSQPQPGHHRLLRRALPDRHPRRARPARSVALHRSPAAEQRAAGQDQGGHQPLFLRGGAKPGADREGHPPADRHHHPQQLLQPDSGHEYGQPHLPERKSEFSIQMRKWAASLVPAPAEEVAEPKRRFAFWNWGSTGRP